MDHVSAANLVNGTPSSTSKPLKKVWILTNGSRGDVQPYIAIAEELLKRGIHVRFYTNSDFVPLANGILKSSNAEVVSFGISSSGTLKENPSIEKAISEGSTTKFAVHFGKYMSKVAPAIADFFTSEIQQGHLPDLSISTPLIRAVAYHLALIHQVPFIEVLCFIGLYNPKKMPLGLPSLPFGLDYYFLRLLAGATYGTVAAFDRHWKSGICERFDRRKLVDSVFEPQLPRIILMAPQLANVILSNPPPMYKFVGMPAIQDQEKKSHLVDFGGKDGLEEVRAFIAKGSKPVYLGWGSMFSKSSEYMTEWCVRALQHSGQRGIVLGGWAKLSLNILLEKDDVLDQDLLQYAKENILFIPYAPHEWLFPRVSVIVHHGGAGTTHASLRSGTPSIITPVFADQYDNSGAVNDLNVGHGFPTQMQKISWKELGDAILRVSSDKEIAERASILGEKIRACNGSEECVNEVDKFWKEFCVTGNFFKIFPGPVKKKGLVSFGKVVAVAVVGIVIAVLRSCQLPVFE